jgi:hypothetical protein
MALSDAQIERYSRQIIVPRVGGRAQERMLASRLLLIGALDDLTEPLAYLAGAGIGRIDLKLGPGAEPQALQRLIARMRELNPEVVVEPASDSPPAIDFDLALAIVGSEAGLEAARRVWADALPGPSVFARLDTPPRIAMFVAPPPCPRCAGDAMLAPFGARSDGAFAVAMAATVEAFKVHARCKPAAAPAIIEFHGLQTQSRPASPGARSGRCGCGGKGASAAG